MRSTRDLSRHYVKTAKSIDKIYIIFLYRPVCASCVLFDLHLKHDIVPLKEGSGYLRESIKESMKKGLLKKEFSESHLLEIREYNLRLDKYRNETIKKIEDCFNSIISTLKKRKSELMSEVLEKFTNEKDKIQNDEDSWIDKQEISYKVLELSKDPNDANILLNAKFIMDSLRLLNQEPQFREAKIFNVIDTSLQLDNKVTLSYEEIIHYLKGFLTIEEPNILEFKS